uniref:Charged multivesicular body protein 1b n=1 Tax=Scophthalmus maximus TaxID=52904 RepID=A0A8D3AJ93_SCOMX
MSSEYTYLYIDVPLTGHAEHLFNLKFSKRLNITNYPPSLKNKNMNKYVYMLFFPVAYQAIHKGNTEAARIHAENAIRQKHQSLNFLRMSARVDAVTSRVQTAVTMNQVSKSMSGVVKSMDATLKSMNLEKVSALMDKFESQFETLDVQTAQMEDTMGNTTTLTTPQVTSTQEGAQSFFLSLDLHLELPSGRTSSLASTVASTEQVTHSLLSL